MSGSRKWSWHAWSLAAWNRHLPEVSDHDAFVTQLGESTIHNIAHRTASARPNRPAINIGGAALTHRELDEKASRAAGWLANNVPPGGRVLIAGPPSFDWIACYLGTLRAGGVAVLANPAYTTAELDELVGASGATVAIGWGDSTRRLAEIASRQRLVMVTDEPGMGVGLPEVFAGMADSVMDRSGSDSTAVLAFTSGTTGRPKGVPLTHRNLLTSIRVAMAAWRWSPDEVLVHALPLFHQHGLGGLHGTLIAGSTMHLLPHFTPSGLLRTVVESRATTLFAVPTMYQRMAGVDGSATGNHLRLAVSGSAPLNEDVAAGAARLLGKVPLVRYGTTESGLDTSHVYADARELGLSNTIGLPLPGLEVRLIDEIGGEAGPDGEGEIQVRGPQVFGGYWMDLEATTAAFAPGVWFRTGDIGRLDQASGHLVIRGRSKEVIITGGLNVYPREVEIALEKHPGVAEAAVAGIPDAVWGEQVTAWVVLSPGHSLNAGDILEHAHTLLAAFKCPKQIYSLEVLPRNAAGKIDRRKLLAS